MLLGLFIFARGLLKIRLRDLPFLIFLGVVFFVLFPVIFNLGIRYTQASRGALMIATMPIWSAILARTAGKERLVVRQVAGMMITFLGVGIVLSEHGLHWQSGPWELAGDGLMLLTALLGAVYGVFAKRMLAVYPALTVTTYAMLFGALLLSPAVCVEGLPGILSRGDGQSIVLVVFLETFCGALGFFLWTFALSRLTTTQVAVYANANPMVAIILGVILLGERLFGVFSGRIGCVGSGYPTGELARQIPAPGAIKRPGTW